MLRRGVNRLRGRSSQIAAAASAVVLETLENRRLLSAGQLNLDLRANLGGATQFNAVTMQGDKIVAGGTLDGQAFVARFKSDGTADTTFTDGTNSGFAILPVGDAVRDVEVTSSKIVVTAEATDSQGYVVQLSATDGSLDTGFNTSGFVALNAAGSQEAYDAAVDSSGNIFVAGNHNDNNIVTGFVTKIDSLGQFALGFGVGGTADLGADYGVASIGLQSSTSSIIIGGQVSFHAALARLDSAGTLDPTFGINNTPLHSQGGLAGIVVDTNGDIFALNNFYTDQSNLAIAVRRYNGTDGSLDTTFGDAGAGGEGVLDASGSGFQLQGTGLGLDSQGNLDVSAVAIGMPVDVGVARFTPAGTLDTSFGGGLVTTPAPGSGDEGVALAVQGDDSVVVAGYDFDGNYIVQRYDGGAVSSPPPTLTVSGTGSANEGAAYTLTLGVDNLGSHTIDHWTIDWGDGDVQTLPGNPTSASHNYADNGTYTIDSSAVDEQGTITGPSSSVTVANVAPTASVLGPSSVEQGVAATFTLDAIDPSSTDQAAGFTFMIDWGDGSPIQNVSALSGSTVDHTFASTGSNTVIVTATDKDGGVSTPPATLTLDVTQPQPPPPPPLVEIDAQGNLVVTPTGSNVGITMVNGQVQVRIDGAIIGSFNPTGGTVIVNCTDSGDVVNASVSGGLGVRVLGGAGNDIVVISGGPSTILGGGGNDIIAVNGGSAILVGGDGNDVLVGSTYRDILIGGSGSDILAGNASDDILIAGSTSYDSDLTALAAIADEWRSSQSYADRVQNIKDGTGAAGRLNGNYFFNPNVNVFDDGVRDLLSGGSGSDWLMFNADPGARDLAFGRTAGEILSDVNVQPPA